MIEVTEVSIAELRAALESGRTTAVELVKAYLARIEAYNGPETATKLNAVVVANPDALKEARGFRCPPRPWRDPGAARRHPLHRQRQLSGQGADSRLRQPGLQGSGGPARCLYR